ncbi:flagellar hook-basal body complex protein FliE [Ferrimonas lipolytica]|uniref:Flagellar hook-basal body complex protein FliE n=1 Tax=Ferrimonas lipolytica TaxID=2724191 RepID=A0A6H1UDV6_9GAMM|nr:flagellar hook-basal body complex protein FliE [Ferrimonas lipolytica]QIZ76809.1 flagellar hook-basal body complex protein FliE [Ferrimonas lipolytica]
MAISAIGTELLNVSDAAIKQDRFEGNIAPADFDQFVQGTDPGSFGDLMQYKLNAINNEQLASSELVKAVELGHSDDLVGAMVATQKAGLSFTAMVQVRNRLVQALDEIMNMAI